jgi:heme-degrading monooxygenase HmoA
MFARVSRFVGLPPERIEATLRMFQEEHLPTIRDLEGYRGVEVLVDRQGGRAIATTYWETQDDLTRSAKAVGEAREAVVSALDPERPPLIENYEVLLSPLSEPQPSASSGTT